MLKLLTWFINNDGNLEGSAESDINSGYLITPNSAFKDYFQLYKKVEGENSIINYQPLIMYKDIDLLKGVADIHHLKSIEVFNNKMIIENV